MADPPPYEHTGVGPDRGSTSGAPRWVKVLGIIALVVTLLVAVLLLAGGGGGGHGPGRHTAASRVTADHAAPQDGHR